MEQVRKQIILSTDLEKKIEKAMDILNLNFSDFIRKAAENLTEEAEKVDLKEFILKNTSIVTEEEQKEIMQVIDNSDSNDKGKEITLDEILQGKI